MLRRFRLLACALAMLTGWIEKPVYAAPCDDAIKNLAGAWTAPESKAEISGGLDADVFGQDAYRARTVALTLQSSGNGTLTISTAIVDEKGQKHAPTQFDVTFSLAPPPNCEGDWISPVVKIATAVKKYTDGSGYRRSLSDVQLAITTDPAGNQVNFWFGITGESDSFSTPLIRRDKRGAGKVVTD